MRVDYIDYQNHTMEELMIRIRGAFLQTTRTIISIETLET